jgi:molybdenum cofactor cytidylyltransferase
VGEISTRWPAVLLAAGEGRRLGQPKALVDLGGETPLGLVSAACREAGFHPLVAVVPPALRDEVVRLIPRLNRVLVNPAPESGPLRSLHIAMEVLPEEAEGFLLVKVDFSLVQTETYRRLASAAREEPGKLWRPVHRDRHGHPVWFPAALFQALRDAPLSEGARTVVYAHREIWGTAVVDDPWIHRDLDTPEDLETFRLHLSQGE